MSVKRIYVEKKAPYAVEAKQLLWEIRHILQIKTVTGLRLLNRYDVEGVDDALYQKCLPVVFSEPQVDVTVDTSVQFNMMAGAFTGGQGDYVTLFEPTATEVERAGHGYILCSIGEESGEIPYTAYFASQSYMTAHPEVIQGFANAIARAQQWIVDHTDREVAEAIIDQFPDTDLDTLEAVTARHRQIDAWNAGPMMARSALERLETVMTEAGELEKDQWVDFDKLVDNSFAQKAMEAQ